MELFQVFIKHVHQFYSHVEVNANRIDELLKTSVKPCNAITNQCLILNSILPKESLEGTGLENLPRFRELLINSVLNSLKKELDLLLHVRESISSSVSDLHEKFILIDKSFKKLQNSNFNYLPVLNPISPRLEYIVDWSMDIWRYYHSLHLQITIAVENVNFENSESVALLTEAFKESEKLKEKVNEIRRFELHSFQFIE